MLRRISLFAVLAAAGLAIAAPSHASAATTIGSNLAGSATQSFSCGASCTVSHSALPIASRAPGGVVAPSDGIVVRWRIKVGSTAGPAALRITRPGNSDSRTGAGTGPTENPPANSTETYDVRLPIEAGDALGIDCCFFPESPMFFAPTPSATYLPWSARLQDGEPARLGASISGELLINADIEPDADRDGFGDETQDQCPNNGATHGSCSNSFTLGRVTRNKKRGTATITVNVPNPGELTGSGKGARVSSARAVTSKLVGAGQARLLIKARRKKMRKLNETGKVKVNLAIAYTPNFGVTSTRSVKVKLKKSLKVKA